MGKRTFIDRLLGRNLGAKTPILDWRSGHRWTMEDSFQGTLIVGNTGSGKTSGSGSTIARAFLRNGYSGLVLCVKQDEADHWRNLCRLEGREGDLVLFRPETGLCYNPLEFEPVLENRVQLFLRLINFDVPGAASASHSFWTSQCTMLLRNLFQLSEAARLPPSIGEWQGIVLGAPQTLADVTSASWRRDSACAAALDTAKKARGSDPDVRMAVHYFEFIFPTMSTRTRSIIVSMVEQTFDLMGRSPLRQLFTGTSTVSPQSLFRDRKILVVDLPVKTMRDVGRLANVLWKYCFQREVERRTEKTPTFLWADEAQFFLTEDDFLFQTTARSSQCATVYLTQNYPNILGAMGQNATDSLVANLLTRLFHRNDCPRTNQWASDMIGKRKQERQRNVSVWADPKLIPAAEYEVSPIVGAERFASLSPGGDGNGKMVEAFGMAPGMRPSSGKRRFHQSKPGKARSACILPR